MKKIVIGILSVGLVYLSGCVSASYTSKNGDEFSYSRLGTQSLTDLEITKSADGAMSVKFNKQEGGENMGALLGTALATAMKGVK